MINRRQFLGSAAGGALMISSSAFAAEKTVAKAAETKAQQPIKGVVRERRNGSPIAGVIVSDGLVCVRTDKKGAYELPFRAEARFIAVTVPSGYSTSCFYYSPKMKSGTHDFYLEKYPLTAGKGCRFVQIADSEVSEGSVRQKRTIDNIKRLAEQSGAFIVHTGDICGRRGMVGYHMMMNAYTMERPVHYVVGNHDLVEGERAEELFEALFGPCWYSFEAGGIHFCTTPMHYGDYAPKYTMDEAADWLANDLALVPKDMPVVLLGHMICSEKSAEDLGFVFGEKRKIDLRKLCNYKGFIYGHLHETLFRRRDGVTMSCSSQPTCGGIDLSPAMIRVVKVDENGGITMENHYGEHPPWKPEKTACLWERKLDGPVMYSAPAVHNGRIFLGTLDDEGRGTAAVYALDAKTGAVAWKHPMVNSVKNRVLVAAGKVVAADAEGRIVALDEKTGAVKWEAALPIYYAVMNAAPAMTPDGKTIIFGTVRWNAAIDAETGKVRWTVRQNASEGVPQRFAVDNERFYGMSSWDGIYACSVKTGKEVWKIKDFGGCVYPGGDPLLLDGKLYVATNNWIREIDPATGKVLRKKTYDRKTNFGVACGPMFVKDGRLIHGTVGRGLVAIDLKTLEIVWDCPFGSGLIATTAYTGAGGKTGSCAPILLKNGELCAPSLDGAVHFLNPADGKQLREIKCGVPYMAGAAETADGVAVADFGGWVRTYKI